MPKPQLSKDHLASTTALNPQKKSKQQSAVYTVFSDEELKLIAQLRRQLLTINPDLEAYLEQLNAAEELVVETQLSAWSQDNSNNQTGVTAGHKHLLESLYDLSIFQSNWQASLQHFRNEYRNIHSTAASLVMKARSFARANPTKYQKDSVLIQTYKNLQGILDLCESSRLDCAERCGTLDEEISRLKADYNDSSTENSCMVKIAIDDVCHNNPEIRDWLQQEGVILQQPTLPNMQANSLQESLPKVELSGPDLKESPKAEDSLQFDLEL